MSLEVERYTIEDVARINGLQGKQRNGEVYCVCPNCGNAKNKFSYVIAKGDKKDVFHCWACGVGGNATDLHMLISGKNFSSHKEAAKDIFKTLEKREYRVFHQKSIKKQQENLKKETPQKSVEYCSKVYFKLLKCLELEESHKKNLLNRGLSEEDISSYKFKSVPSKKKALSICKALASKYDLEGVPGFFYEDGHWDMFRPDKGIFCPAYDGRTNLLLGFQIRLDNPWGKTKYLWFSSVNKEKGTSSGAISSFLPGKGTSCIVIEGLLKAQIVYCRLKGLVTVIGVPGTKSFKALHTYLKDTKFAVCFEAYDMDKAEQIQLDNKHIEKVLRFIQADRKKQRVCADDYSVTVENTTKVYRQCGARTMLIKEFECKLDVKEFEEAFNEAKKSLRIAEDADKMKMLVSSYNIPVQSIVWDAGTDGLWKGQYKGLDDYIFDEGNLNKMLNFIERMAEKLSTK